MASEYLFMLMIFIFINLKLLNVIAIIDYEVVVNDDDNDEQSYINRILNITNCGQNPLIKTYDSYIVGGIESRTNSWPWMVGIYRRNRFICGGTIINDKYILTAAHCVQRNSQSIELFKIFIGNHRLPSLNNNNNHNHNHTSINHSFSNGQFLSIVKIIVHESYHPMTMINDIALLKLNETLNLSSSTSLQPICLPNTKIDEKIKNGINTTIIGWGHKHEGGVITNRLHEVQIPIISNEKCEKIYGPKRINQKHICAIDNDNGGTKDSCQGDSGGPMLLEYCHHNHNNEINKKFYQIGIVSWGRGCARPNYPGVYTRVAKYVEWILDQIADQNQEYLTTESIEAMRTTELTPTTISMTTTLEDYYILFD